LYRKDRDLHDITGKFMEENIGRRKKWGRIAKTLLKVTVTLIALYWVSTKVNFLDVRDALLRSNFFYLLLALLMYFISQLIASSRLYGYFRGIGLPINETYNFKLYLLGLFYNMFLPGGIGGDGYKLYFLRKKFGISGKKLFSAIFFDRLSGLWALSLITAALVIFIPQLGIPNWVPIIVVLLGTIIYYLLLWKFFKTFAGSFFISHLKAVGAWSFQIIAVILLLYALGFDGKFSPYLFTFLLSSLVAVIPLSAGGLGLREMANVYGATYFSLDTHLAVLISLLFYIIALLVAFGGAYFIFRPDALGEHRLPKADEVEKEMDNLL